MTIERKKHLDQRHIKEIEANWSDFHQQHFDLNVEESFWYPWGGKWETRLGEVLFLLPRPGGVLLHRKSDYPPNAWRALTGSIKLSEQLTDTLTREIREEVGLSLPIKRYVGMITYSMTHKMVTLPWVTHVFVMSYSDVPLLPSVDGEIEATKVIPFDQLDRETDKLERLPRGWDDWGRYRAIAHRFISKHVTAEELVE